MDNAELDTAICEVMRDYATKSLSRGDLMRAVALKPGAAGDRKLDKALQRLRKQGLLEFKTGVDHGWRYIVPPGLKRQAS